MMRKTRTRVNRVRRRNSARDVRGTIQVQRPSLPRAYWESLYAGLWSYLRFCVIPALLLTSILVPSAFAAGVETERLGAELTFTGASRLTLSPFAAHPLPAPAAPLPPQVCSGLDFKGVTWPPSMNHDDELALELALDISGSFEGADGWANLTGNFDGQGFSLGLLNQNLGQGSLQPMLIRLRDRHPEVLAAVLSPAHLASLSDMLARWEGSAAPSGVSPLSRLDEPPPGGRAMSVREAESVAWASQNLYAGEHFDPVWKAELINLASGPEFVSLQIAAALDLHEQALAYESRIGVRELRAYLMLFDVVVQNGSLYSDDLSDYDAYRRGKPDATSAQKLEMLLALRLRHVRSRFVADVRSRKRAIIRGKGVVHGEVRDLPVQYCYDGGWLYR